MEQSNKNTICYSCRKPTDPESHHLTKFKNCKEQHTAQICQDCRTKNWALRHNSEKKICFLCTTSLENHGNYKTETLTTCKDGEEHQAWFCAECFLVHDKLKEPKAKCYICQPPEGEECGICRTELDFDAYISLKKCKKRPYHRIKACNDCLSFPVLKDKYEEKELDFVKLVTNKLSCKFCANRQYEACSIFFPQTNFIGRYSIPCLIIGENSLHPGIHCVDDEICSTCNPVSIGSKTLNSCIDESFDNRGFKFIQGSSTVQVGEFWIVSGGFSLDSAGTLFGSSDTFIIRFIQEANIQHYHFPIGLSKTQLKQKRYFHKTFYSEKHKKVAVFGGLNILRDGTLSYLDNIETTSIDGETTTELVNGGGLVWKANKLKNGLKKPRACFEGFMWEDCAYLFGGYSGYNQIENSIERYSFADNTTELMTFKTPDNFVFPASTFLFQKSNSNFLIVGGQVGEKTKTNKVYGICAETQTITQTNTELNEKRSGHKGTMIKKEDGSKVFIVFGGSDKQTQPKGMDFEVYLDSAEHDHHEETNKWLNLTNNKIFDLNLEKGTQHVSALNIPYIDCFGFRFQEINFDQLSS